MKMEHLFNPGPALYELTKIKEREKEKKVLKRKKEKGFKGQNACSQSGVRF